MCRISCSYRENSIAPIVGTPIRNEDGKIIGKVTDVNESAHIWYGEVEETYKDVLINKDSYLSMEINYLRGKKEKKNDIT